MAFCVLTQIYRLVVQDIGGIAKLGIFPCYHFCEGFLKDSWKMSMDFSERQKRGVLPPLYLKHQQYFSGGSYKE